MPETEPRRRRRRRLVCTEVTVKPSTVTELTPRSAATRSSTVALSWAVRLLLGVSEEVRVNSTETAAVSPVVGVVDGVWVGSGVGSIVG